MTRHKTARMGIRLDVDTLDLLQRIADREGRTVSAIVREAVRHLSTERLVFSTSQ